MTTGQVTLEVVVASVWARRTADGAPGWMRGLGASDTRRQLGPAVAGRRHGLAAPTPGGQGRRTGPVVLDPDEARDLEAWLAGPGWDAVRDLCEVALRLKDRTVRDLRRSGAAVLPRAVGSWALTVVADRHRRYGGCPYDEDLTEAEYEFRCRFTDEEPLRRMRLGPADFEAVAGPAWDRLWPPDQVLPEAHRPSLYGLGADARPPLFGRCGNWRCGTDRPIFLRYRRYFDGSARTQAPGVDPECHVTRRYRDREPSSVVLDEVRRAARPFGLADAGHAAAVVAVAQGMRPGRGRDTGTAPTPAEWVDRCTALSDEADVDLERVVTDVAARWIATTTRTGVIGLNGRDLADAVTRRVHHVLHGREVVWDTPLDRAEFATALRGSFDRHLVEYGAPPGRKDPAGAEPGGRPEDVTRSADEVPAAASDLTAVQKRTLDMLKAEPRSTELVELVLIGDERWRALYDGIVEGVDGVLDADGFHELALDLAEVN